MSDSNSQISGPRAVSGDARFTARWRTLPPFLGLAILIHVLLVLPLLSVLLQESPSATGASTFNIDLWSGDNRAASRKNQLDEDAVVVDMPDDLSPETSKPTRYLSRDGSSSQQQTKQRSSGRRIATTAEKSKQPPKRRPQKQMLQNTAPTVPTRVADALPTQGNIILKTDPQPLEQTPLERKPLKLRPDDATLSTAIAGSGLADLGDVIEGDKTSLNSAAFRHASFFTRVQRMVEQFWRPDMAIQKHDPDARFIGSKDRTTTVLVVLQSNGQIHHLYTRSPSGAGFLDDEATKAIRMAGPFPNVPKGLISSKDGLVKFLFQFTVEINRKPAVRIRRYD